MMMSKNTDAADEDVNDPVYSHHQQNIQAVILLQCFMFQSVIQSVADSLHPLSPSSYPFDCVEVQLSVLSSPQIHLWIPEDLFESLVTFKIGRSLVRVLYPRNLATS